MNSQGPGVLNVFEESLEKNTPQTYSKNWYKFMLSPLWLCLLVAIVIRTWLIVRTHGIIDGDEALVGIQAERILHGDFPAYFYGIPYFGSLEAYLTSILFAIFGPSSWALRAEATIMSCTLVWLTWRFASAMADAAQLPLYAKRCFTLIAGLLAAVPPLYDGIVELRTWGGYIETFVLLLLLLLSVFRLTRRWHEDASTHELLWRWAGIGCIVGLGLWVYPLIVCAIVASVIWILGDRLAEGLKLRQALAATQSRTLHATVHSAKPLLSAVVAIPASLLGSLPAILWGATHQWQNILYIRQLGGTWSLQRLHTVYRVTKTYITCIAPRVISGALPQESKLSATLHVSLLVLTLFSIFATIMLIVASFIWHHPTLIRARHLAGLPMLFGACATIIYCTGSASESSLISCNLDFAGRYATPIVLALPFFYATIFTLMVMYLYERRSSNPPQTMQYVHSTIHTRSGAPGFSQRTLLSGGVLLAILLAYLGIQTWTYGLSVANQTFQSPFCTIAPANYDPIIAYMQQQHINYAWAPNLLAHPIIFKTDRKIIVVDPLATMHPPQAINRIPSYTNAVMQADRPGFLVFVHHGDAHPLLLRLLDTMQVSYLAAFFPSENGIDVLVVKPISRTVLPSEIRNMEPFYCMAT